MKNIKVILFSGVLTLMSFGAIVFSACTKVKCENVTCQNGGSCSNGVCSCPTGYSGTFCETVATSAISFKNNTFTPISISVNDVGLVIPVGGSVSFTGKYNTTATGSATTSGAATSLGISTAGGVIGLPINWNLAYTFPAGDTLRVPLDIGSGYFFLRLVNKGSEDIINYYVNAKFPYGQSYEDITVPHDGKTYDMGYYLAYPYSNVQTQSGAHSRIKYYDNLGLPSTSNQTITVTVTD